MPPAMTETDDIVARLQRNADAQDKAPYEPLFDTDLMREAAAHITRLGERCAAYKGQVEAGAAEIERLREDRRAAEAEMAKARREAKEAEGDASLWWLSCEEGLHTPLLVRVWRQRKEATRRAKSAEARADALQAEVERLRTLVESAQSIFEHCEVTDGMCCCGDDMKAHGDPMSCGHAPVDHGGYIVSQWLKEVSLQPQKPKP